MEVDFSAVGIHLKLKSVDRKFISQVHCTPFERSKYTSHTDTEVQIIDFAISLRHINKTLRAYFSGTQWTATSTSYF